MRPGRAIFTIVFMRNVAQPSVPPPGGPLTDPFSAIPALPRQEIWLEAGQAVLDEHANVIEINEALAAWLGEAPASLNGAPLPLLLASRCGEWESAWTALESREETFAEAEWTLLGKKGAEPQWFKAALTRHPGGKVFRLDSSLPPIQRLTEHGGEHCFQDNPAARATFFKLLRASEQLQQLLARWPGVVFTQRPDGRIYSASPRIEELTGVPVSVWERDPGALWRVIHEADAAPFRHHFQAASKTPQGLTCDVRIRNARTGRVYYIHEHRRAVFTNTGLLLGYEGFWQDVTQQTMVEKRLQAAAWKETLSALTMGLAHDFRNVLTGVISMSEVILAQVKTAHPFSESLKLIRSNCWEATHSLQRLLQLYHGQSGEAQYADVNELVRELREHCGQLLSRKIEIEMDLVPWQLPAYLDTFEFRQAFFNLAINARDAMPHGGKLLIRTSRHTRVPDLGFSRGQPPRGPALCVSVRDAGTGIAPEVLPRIFDPFFTTKGVEQGTGLGLHNVMRFVEKHRGAISVETAPGAGAAFHLWLPEANFDEDAPALERTPVSVLLFGPAGATRASIAKLMERQGFQVIKVAKLKDAWRELKTASPPFDAVLMQTDAKCPAFFADIRKERLPVKTILQVVACHQDEVETSFLASADLVLSLETDVTRIPAQIRALLPVHGGG